MQPTDRADLTYYAKLAQHKVGYVAGQLELTSKCEQLCPNCDSWKAHRDGRFRGHIPFENVRHIFEQLSAMPTFEHLALTGGDPVSYERFYEVIQLPRRFKLQVNTAMPLPISAEQADLWRRRVDSIRLSLDGVVPETYYKMRGVRTDPEEILERMEYIQHPFWATNTCVADVNVEEMIPIIARLSDMHSHPRRANFLAVLDRETRPDFWEKYRKMAATITQLHREMEECPCDVHWMVDTSVAEDVRELRDFLLQGKAAEIPCRVGGITFHIKCDGDVYPCCLTGGEAIITRPEFVVGNIFQELLADVQKRYVAKYDYANKAACRQICQWKQFQLNLLASKAEETWMRMP